MPLQSLQWLSTVFAVRLGNGRKISGVASVASVVSVRDVTECSTLTLKLVRFASRQELGGVKSTIVRGVHINVRRGLCSGGLVRV